MSEEKEIGEQIAALTTEIREASQKAAATHENKATEAVPDLAKALSELSAAREELKRQGERSDGKAELAAAVDEAVKAHLRGVKAPSLAASIGQGLSPEARREAQLHAAAHPTMKAAFGDSYTAGTFVSALAESRAIGGNLEAAKATLAGLGTFYADVPESSKATLGTTGATGGYVLPNNLVDSVVKPSTQIAIYQNLVTVVNGVAVRGVDQPYRLGVPSRATFIDWGNLKENVNETYGSYTATLGTLAKIYDVSAQYLRFSAGSAEQDIMDELSKSFALAENFAVMAGPGTGAATPGVNDPTEGIYTALAASSSFAGPLGTGYKSTFTGTSSNSTIIGSAGRNFATMLGKLASRNRGLGDITIVVDAATYWTIASQGTDTAGFWLTPSGGPSGFSMNGGRLSFWNVPILYDSNLDANTTTHTAVAGDFKALKFYRGLEFRIDSSNIAGTRWDYNLVGFRGEEEIGVNALTAVNVGAFELGINITP